MNDFLKYWDEVLAYWVEYGEVPASESCWDFEKIGLYCELMPEPYIGNPADCSVVILNYNPGAAKYDLRTQEGVEMYRKDAVHHSRLDDPEAMCHHYARDYRERAFAGSYLGKGVDPKYDTSGLHPKGKQWWEKRLDWFRELVPESKKLPFALELCGWHSYKWENIKYDEKLLNRLKEVLAPVIDEAIKASDLGIGLCVGAQWSAQVLPAVGYRDVTAEVMGLTDYRRGWKPLGGQRNYCIMRNDNGTYIINTWLSRAFNMMRVPSEEFRSVEKDIINRIKESEKPTSLLDAFLDDPKSATDQMCGFFKPNV